MRWIQVLAGNTISWSLQPHKKSLNFGIFKHPGGKEGLPNAPLQRSTSNPGTPTVNIDQSASKLNGRDGSSVVQKLENLGMKCVAWSGKCDADKVAMGKFDVLDGEGGMYGLVFDNTFSKTVTKSATFVLMTYPTNAPPRSGHHLHFSQAAANTSTGSITPHASPALVAASKSSDSIPTLSRLTTGVASDPRPKTGHLTQQKSSGGSTFYTGVLLKKRRLHSNHAKRFFSLDFTTLTLSYYRNRQSSALRGAVPLSLASIATNEQTREILVDSGAEVWHLKAPNSKEFIGWRDALERASQAATSMIADGLTGQDGSAASTSRAVDPIDDQHWTRAERLVGQIAGIRDAVRRLARDTDPKYLPSANNHSQLSGSKSPSIETTSFDLPREDDRSNERIAFWKRKSSASAVMQSPAANFRRSVSAQLAVPSPSFANQNFARRPSSPLAESPGESIHDNCMAILQDMDQAIGDFSALINESKQHRFVNTRPLSRAESTTSVSEDEWFDARDDRMSRSATRSQLLPLYNEEPQRKDESSERDMSSIEEGSDSDSDSEELELATAFSRRSTRLGGAEGTGGVYPIRAQNMFPLPLKPVPRRQEVPPAKISPPSLISFFRKNVGKDLSSIAMPVSSNEPTSMLQRVAEELEYSELLDQAAADSSDATQRLLRIAAFAVSSFSNSRARERAARKPFNPMLGETFELVREDKGYRFLAEKIEHRPVKIACQAESDKWTFLHTPVPMQKFWGKSAEINTEGRARVFLHTIKIDGQPGPETYSWTLATSFLRNMIAGEKYIEPVGSMTIINESTGAKAVASFKAGGMFAGRSEEVDVQVFDGDGTRLSTGLHGKWTSHLDITSNGNDTGEQIWAVGSLVAQPEKRWGFTTFAAALNEITPIEEHDIPPTDSRLRPDQRAYEDGSVDGAEAMKARLEERQRSRRRVMEEHGEDWKPRWFMQSGADGDEQIWRLKDGAGGYWDSRARGDWSGVVDIFQH